VLATAAKIVPYRSALRERLLSSINAGREATYLLLLQGEVPRWVVSGTVNPEWITDVDSMRIDNDVCLTFVKRFPANHDKLKRVYMG
jgi:hypothetical protein